MHTGPSEAVRERVDVRAVAPKLWRMRLRDFLRDFLLGLGVTTLQQSEWGHWVVRRPRWPHPRLGLDNEDVTRVVGGIPRNRLSVRQIRHNASQQASQADCSCVMSTLGATSTCILE